VIISYRIKDVTIFATGGFFLLATYKKTTRLILESVGKNHVSS
jgi:hypothetical protein